MPETIKYTSANNSGSSVQTSLRGYFPQLDAIRGLSFLAVFFYHAWQPVFTSGPLSQTAHFFYSCLDYSIDVFFVLSSFLLTWLGISEFRSTGNFSFRNYFVRRTLRIWPLYYVIMIFSFIIVPQMASYMHMQVSLPPSLPYLFFVSNFYNGDHVYFLRFLWTLSAEEQFYLVLGISLAFMHHHLTRVISILIAAGLIFCIWCAATNADNYFNTLTYIFDFGAGALAALLMKNAHPVINRLQQMTKTQQCLFYLSLPVMLLVFYICAENVQPVFADILTVCCRFLFILFVCVLIIMQMNDKTSAVKLGRSRFLVFTGKFSYGLYCFHGIILTAGNLFFARMEINMHPLLKACIFLAVDFGVAAVSYFILEKPFLKLKDRFRRVSKTETAPLR